MKKLREDEYTEFKEIYTDNIKKEVIAFANSNGGKLYIGIDDSGAVVGLANAVEVMGQISNALRDSIKPDITMFVHYELATEAGREYIIINIQRGTDRPYYLAAKGLKPVGVYVWQGSSSVPASDAAIRRMIKETDGELFENMRSLKQDLTFEYAGASFKRYGVQFGYVQMQTLGMIKDDTVYTNLALLFSDQCPHIIKAATFKGVNQEEFQDRTEFSGSLLKQLDDAYEYLDKRNNLHGSYQGLQRIDILDYPKLALREALLNAIVHRDYAFIAPTLISVYDDRVEFISIGGLLDGVSYDAIMAGLSVCRNPKLANIFFRLQLIEAYGTGMGKIMSGYKGYEVKPTILVPQGAFKVILPNVNYKDAVVMTEVFQENSSYSTIDTEVLAFIEGKESVSRAEIQSKFGLTLSTCARILRKALERGAIKTLGKGKNTRYRKVN